LPLINLPQSLQVERSSPRSCGQMRLAHDGDIV
jgi:hypothetical protein